jgi:MerR family transcriptional regulator, heat shock protein HspR
VPRKAKESNRLFTISVVARMLGVHQQTLRIYEKEGLVKPARTQGNTRLYSEDDVEEVRFILRLTNDLGVNLAGVGVILELRRQMEEMERRYDQQMKTMLEEFSRQFSQFLRDASCVPVISHRETLIIHREGDIEDSL